MSYSLKSIYSKRNTMLLACLILLGTTELLGQSKRLKELSVSSGVFQINERNLSPSQISQQLDRYVSLPDFTEQAFYGTWTPSRAFNASFERLHWQSNNLRVSVLFGGFVSAQFYHQARLIGTEEVIVEDIPIPAEPGWSRQVSQFKTSAYTIFGDYITVGPQMSTRFIFNQRLSAKAGLSFGGMIPIKTGIQVSSYTGTVTRKVSAQENYIEDKQYDGNLDIRFVETHSNLVVSGLTRVQMEFKPFSRRSIYLTAGSVLGAQYGYRTKDWRPIYGYQFGVISQFN